MVQFPLIDFYYIEAHRAIDIFIVKIIVCPPNIFEFPRFLHRFGRGAVRVGKPGFYFDKSDNIILFCDDIHLSERVAPVRFEDRPTALFQVLLRLAFPLLAEFYIFIYFCHFFVKDLR